MRGNGSEVVAALVRAEHQTLQPGIFELFAAPELRKRGAMRWEKPLRRRLHRMHIEQRAVCVEHQRVDRQCGCIIGNHRGVCEVVFATMLCKKRTEVAHMRECVQKNRGYTCV